MSIEYWHITHQQLELTVAFLIVGVLLMLFALTGRWIREKLFLSEILVSLAAGIAFGPYGLKVITWSWLTDPEKLFVPLLWITRIVLAFQLMASALGLGSEYWAKHWRTQLTMLGLVMPLMWLTSSALLYAIIPSIGSFLHALLIGAHVTPTDPVLAAAVVQGKFAEKLIPKGVRTTIAAESIANDGTNLPFFKLPILLTLYGVRNGLAWGSEFYWTILYQVLVTGAVAFGIGCAAARLLRLAEKVGSMDRDTYLIFPVALSFMLLCVGVLMGGSEVIAVFIGGTGFVFAAHEDHAFEAADTQDLLDTLTTFTSFFVFGLIIPWDDFGRIGVGWLFLAAFIVLPFRRIPYTVLFHTLGWLPDTHDKTEAAFLGWFGPVGVGALYYSALSHEEFRDDRAPFIISCFFVLVSAVLHGVTSQVFSRLLGRHVRTRKGQGLPGPRGQLALNGRSGSMGSHQQSRLNGRSSGGSMERQRSGGSGRADSQQLSHRNGKANGHRASDNQESEGPHSECPEPHAAAPEGPHEV